MFQLNRADDSSFDWLYFPEFYLTNFKFSKDT